MNITLTRNSRRPDGIFSTATDDGGHVVMSCLEHAYLDGDDWQPKIPAGTYPCRRGPHRLHGMTEDFSTFEIMGVAGHQGLLFHWGNFNRDSEGCVLVGHNVVKMGDGTQMISGSRAQFAAFMALQAGLDEFQLTVKG